MGSDQDERKSRHNVPKAATAAGNRMEYRFHVIGSLKRRRFFGGPDFDLSDLGLWHEDVLDRSPTDGRRLRLHVGLETLFLGSVSASNRGSFIRSGSMESADGLRRRHHFMIRV